MKSIKFMFFLTTCLGSLHIFAMTDSSMDINCTPTGNGEKCIKFLDNSPQENWSGTKICGGLTLFFLSLAVAPGAGVCAFFGSSSTACLATAVPTAIVGGLGSLFSFCSGCWSVRQELREAAVKETPLIVAQLIKDAYSLEAYGYQDHKSLKSYLDDYWRRHALSEEGIQSFARKIILANEGGRFVPAEALFSQEVIAQYSSALDMPDHQSYFKDLSLGTLRVKRQKEIQPMVDRLLGMSLEDLKQQRKAFQDAVLSYDQAIADFLKKANYARETRIIVEENTSLIN